MQTYISQLLEDLENASQNPVKIPDYKILNPNHPAIDYGLDYIVGWECAPYISMADAFGIAAEAFPPPEQLNEEQAEQLINAILKLWEVNNIIADFLEIMPPTIVIYRVLRKKWQESKIQLLSEGYLHLEFCSYEPQECPWGIDFCYCKNQEWNNDDFDMTKDSPKNDFPF